MWLQVMDNSIFQLSDSMALCTLGYTSLDDNKEMSANINFVFT